VALAIDTSKFFAKRPSQDPFDHLTARQRMKSGGRRRAFDELDCPMAKFREPIEQLVASKGAVGNEMAQPREEVVDGRHDQPSAVAILDVGGMNRSVNQQTGGVGHDVALAPLDLLGGIVPLRSTALGRLE
jgi:hypothetical protein